MKNGPPFHLSVSKTGLVSLWDSAQAAKSVKDETYVPLVLTKRQLRTLEVAQTRAMCQEKA